VTFGQPLIMVIKNRFRRKCAC